MLIDDDDYEDVSDLNKLPIKIKQYIEMKEITSAVL